MAPLRGGKWYNRVLLVVCVPMFATRTSSRTLVFRFGINRLIKLDFPIPETQKESTRDGLTHRKNQHAGLLCFSLCLSDCCTISRTGSLPCYLTHCLDVSLAASLPHLLPRYRTHCLAISLASSLPHSLPRYLTISLTVPLTRYLTHCLDVSLTASLPHSLPRCLTHYRTTLFTAPLPRYLTHCLTYCHTVCSDSPDCPTKMLLLPANTLLN